MRTTNGSWVGMLGGLGVLALAGCSSAIDDAGENVAESRSEVRFGTVVTPWGPNWAPWETKAIVQVPGCTGTLVQPSWVLTAQHCNTWVGAQVVSIRPTGNVVRTVDARLKNPSSSHDTLLLHLDSPITDITPAIMHGGRSPELYGQDVDCYGYGAQDFGPACDASTPCPSGQWCSHWGVCLTSSNELRTARLRAEAYQVNPNVLDDLTVPMNASGQTLLPGDSGGPCFRVGALASVCSWGNTSTMHEATIAPAREWIKTASRIMYTPGDFNGDGKKDVIITHPTGSYWYYSNGGGSWTEGFRDLNLKLGDVTFVVAKFDQDNRDDVLITTDAGTAIYYATSVMGQWNVLFSHSDWYRWAYSFTAGDFNRDGWGDLIVQNDQGTSWYNGTALGGFSVGYQRPDLPVGAADYVTGDFNGDRRTDVIITTGAGSYFYFANNSGGFTERWARTDLPLQAVKFTPGDFDGDEMSDVMITTSASSSIYYSTGSPVGVPFKKLWTHAGVTLANTAIAAGRLDGDLKYDVIISDATGSYFWYSTGYNFVQSYVRTDLVWPGTQYTIGDYSGGGGLEDVIISNTSGSYWYYSTGRGTFSELYTRTDLPM